MDNARRHWAFTLNNYTHEDEERFRDNWKYSYLIMGKEVGESGTPHIQGYVCFETKIRLAQCKALDSRIHWEACRGTPTQNRDYCSKAGDFREYGTLPKTGGEVEKDRWKHIIDLAKEGNVEEFIEEYPQQAFLHFKKFKSMREHFKKPKGPIETLEHYWYMGNAGTGKSRVARDKYPDAYLKPTDNKWWPGYHDQEVVLIDDLCKNHDYVLQWLKNWADHYPFQAECKGGHTGLIRPKHIIVTTQYHWSEITDDVQLQDAISRRFTIVRFGDGIGEDHWRNHVFPTQASTIVLDDADGEASTVVLSPSRLVRSRAVLPDNQEGFDDEWKRRNGWDVSDDFY